MRTLKLTLAYDGTHYSGWQHQPGRTTVQGRLEAALAKVTGQPVRVRASSRTDAGVHAWGQVVGLVTESALPPDVLRRALNAELPPDICVRDVAEASEGFHATRDALRKRYRYVICDGPVRDVFRRHYCWHYARGRLDADAMHRAAQSLVGRHDFRSFEKTGAPRESSVRTIFEIRVSRKEPFSGGACPAPADCGLATAGPFSGGACPAPPPALGASASPPGQGRGGGGDWIVLEVAADGFLYNMVRAIVGTLVEVGRGVRPETWPAEVLAAANRSAAGPTAPPQGLFLVAVSY